MEARPIPATADAYLFHLCRNHAFIDGNKRVGADTAITFVPMNDWEPAFDENELVDLVLAVASGRVAKSGLIQTFESSCRPPCPSLRASRTSGEKDKDGRPPHNLRRIDRHYSEAHDIYVDFNFTGSGKFPALMRMGEVIGQHRYRAVSFGASSLRDLAYSKVENALRRLPIEVIDVSPDPARRLDRETDETL